MVVAILAGVLVREEEGDGGHVGARNRLHQSEARRKGFPAGQTIRGDLMMAKGRDMDMDNSQEQLVLVLGADPLVLVLVRGGGGGASPVGPAPATLPHVAHGPVPAQRLHHRRMAVPVSRT